MIEDHGLPYDIRPRRRKAEPQVRKESKVVATRTVRDPASLEELKRRCKHHPAAAVYTLVKLFDRQKTA